MTYILLFILGTILASFLNALMYRLDNGFKMPELLAGRSKCENCGKELTWLELLPIAGYFVGGGKCKECGEDINWYYPLSELLLGLFFVAIYYLEAGIFTYLATIILFSLSYFDVTSKSIPAVITHGLIALGVIYTIYKSWIYGMVFVSSGVWVMLFIGILTMILNRFKKSFGLGDLLVFLGLSLFLSAFQMVVLYFISAIVAVLFLLPLIVMDRKWLKRYVPYVPFISISYILTLLLTPTLLDWFTTYYLL